MQGLLNKGLMDARTEELRRGAHRAGPRDPAPVSRERRTLPGAASFAAMAAGLGIGRAGARAYTLMPFGNRPLRRTR
jgi:hypothetical protein